MKACALMPTLRAVSSIRAFRVAGSWTLVAMAFSGGALAAFTDESLQIPAPIFKLVIFDYLASLASRYAKPAGVN